jgi:hypothetical protein
VQDSPNHPDAALRETLPLQLAKISLNFVRPKGGDVFTSNGVSDVVDPGSLVPSSSLGRQIVPTVVLPSQDRVVDRGGRPPWFRILGVRLHIGFDEYRSWFKVDHSDHVRQLALGLSLCPVKRALLMANATHRVAS